MPIIKLPVQEPVVFGGQADICRGGQASGDKHPERCQHQSPQRGFRRNLQTAFRTLPQFFVGQLPDDEDQRGGRSQKRGGF